MRGIGGKIMSLDGLRGLLSDQAAQSERANRQQDSGNQRVRQGVGVQGSEVTLSINSQSFVGARVLSNSFNQSLSLGNFRPDFSNPEPEESASLFDFEEVARNVLRFVGSVITGARNSGADEDELTDLFEQAREGVGQGISLAERDLGGLLNDEIAEGIENSRNRIEEGLQTLEQDIFNPNPEADGQSQSVEFSQTIQAARQNNGELTIRTRDGDEIFVRFDSLQALQIDRTTAIELQQNTEQNQEQVPSNNNVSGVAENTPVGQAPENTADINVSAQVDGEALADEEVNEETEQNPQGPDVVNVQSQSNSVFLQRDEFSLSVTGQLDEEELEAIGDLLNDVSDLAGEFFNGDVEAAFEQALDLGFNDEELVGFALQLTNVQQVQVVETYESVSRFTDNQEQGNNARAGIEPIADYLQQLQQVFDQDSLIEPQSVNDFVQQLVDRIFDVPQSTVQDQLSRFSQFNQRLLNNIAQS